MTHFSRTDLDYLLDVSKLNDGLTDAEVRPLIETFFVLLEENVELSRQLDRIESESIHEPMPASASSPEHDFTWRGWETEQ